jgi:HSF-type DNA-binding
MDNSCSPLTPALYDNGCSSSAAAAASWVPEILIPQLQATGSCSVDPLMLSLVDPVGRHGMGAGSYMIQPMQEPTYAQPSYLFGNGDCAAAAHHASSGAAPFLTTHPYSADPAVLASILSMLERPHVVVSNAIPLDIPNAKVAAGDKNTSSSAAAHRKEGPSPPPSSGRKIQAPPHASVAGKCPHLSSEPEEEADKGSVADVTHQRQHLLTTSLGPGAYFRARKRRPYRHESFPEKLHRMLLQAELHGKGDVVCFTPSGLAFEIHRVDEFISDVIPEFFRHKSISSFRRQLSMYGFKRVKDNGPDHGAYQHELFRRDDPTLCRQMKRVTELELILPDDPTASFPN